MKIPLFFYIENIIKLLKLNNMIAICSDCHGRQFWKDVIPRKDEFEKIIFLGDYLDPYGFEGVSNLNALDNFKEILEFKKENIDKVVLLIGNHKMFL